MPTIWALSSTPKIIFCKEKDNKFHESCCKPSFSLITRSKVTVNPLTWKLATSISSRSDFCAFTSLILEQWPPGGLGNRQYLHSAFSGCHLFKKDTELIVTPQPPSCTLLQFHKEWLGCPAHILPNKQWLELSEVSSASLAKILTGPGAAVRLSVQRKSRVRGTPWLEKAGQ